MTAMVNCAPAGHSILRLWRGPSSRTCSTEGMAVFSYRKWHSSYRFNGFSGGGAAHFVILSGEKRRMLKMAYLKI